MPVLLNQSMTGLTGKVLRLAAQVRAKRAADKRPLLAKMRADPTAVLRLAGMEPDPWQRTLLLSSAARALVLCSRQVGKTCAAAGVVLNEVLPHPNRLALIVAPSQRQSTESYRRVAEMYKALGCPVAVKNESALRVELVNGSRVVALPGASDAAVRGYSPNLVVVDEAARTSDELMTALRPSLAVTGGRLLALTTPYGRRGWFHAAWTGGADDWQRVSARAADCKRIGAEFLAAEMRDLGRYYAQEYELEFLETADAFFAVRDIDNAMTADVKPLWS